MPSIKWHLLLPMKKNLMSMGKGGSVQPMLPPVKFKEFAEESVIPPKDIFFASFPEEKCSGHYLLVQY